MTKIETIELYGVITKITAISAHDVIVDVKEEGTGKVWEVVLADDMRTHFDLEEGLHVYARGAKALGGIFADCFEEWGRVCAVCGKWHTEGYYVLENDYACSEECAVYLYHGDWNAFKADLALLDFPDTADNAPTYWTEWE
jgi:hypothetical protein